MHERATGTSADPVTALSRNVRFVPDPAGASDHASTSSVCLSDPAPAPLCQAALLSELYVSDHAIGSSVHQT